MRNADAEQGRISNAEHRAHAERETIRVRTKERSVETRIAPTERKRKRRNIGTCLPFKGMYLEKT